MRERIEAQGRVLFAAAQADGHVEAPEVDKILEILEREWRASGGEGKLPPELIDSLSSFTGDGTSMADLAQPFRDGSHDDRRRLLDLVVEVHEADGELDYEEDTFVRELGVALGLAESQFRDLLLEIVDAPAAPKAKPASKKKLASKKKPAPKKPKAKPAPKAKKPATKRKR